MGFWEDLAVQREKFPYTSRGVYPFATAVERYFQKLARGDFDCRIGRVPAGIAIMPN